MAKEVEYDWEEYKARPQVPTRYGFFVYKKEIIVLVRGRGKKKGLTESKYVKINRKSYKNLKWLDRMYKRHKKQKTESELFKVIIPLDFPVGYKLYDHNAEYYGTIVRVTDIFNYTVVKGKKEPHPFLPTSMEKFFVKAAAGSYGFTVPLEFVEGYERAD